MSLRIRLLSTFILIPTVVGLIYLGGIFYFVTLTGGLLLAGWEFFSMLRNAGNKPQSAWGIALIALLAINAQWQFNATGEIISAILLLSLSAAIFRPGDGWLVGWALTIAGALYVGLFGSHIVAIRALPDGMLWTTLAIFTTAATDMFAYLFGTLFGRRKFFPHISPKKTWEGALGGIAGAIAIAWAIGSLIGLELGHALAFGFIVSLAATFGDLAESLIKRQLGAKDSGVIVPGHGGLLDRLDSLLFAFVVAYYFVVWLIQK